jgi:lipopolysaccharide transport system ATP-binding protein
MTTGVRAEGLGKQYGLIRAADSGLKRSISRRLRPSAAAEQMLWALRDLTFTVREGESVGVIGPNGAGKSTLFKIISHVTTPTQGTLEITGRVGALIELGAGFHPELSGRENIFLCGSILGMRKREIAARLDEIIAFSELEAFIDAPVKRYSSGMFLRLGFSVAAHLYPDILLMDEILSVGDLAFQKKCVEWMYRYADSRRIFFLASHQMHHIETLCRRVLYLNKGRIAFDGPAERAISLYLSDLGCQRSRGNSQVPEARLQASPLVVSSVSIWNDRDQAAETVFADAPLRIRIEYDAPAAVRQPKMEIAVNCEGRRIGQANTIGDGTPPGSLSGKGFIDFLWPRCFLTPNYYTVDVYISDGRTLADLFVWKSCLGFRVLAPPGSRMASGEPGFLKIPGNWSFSEGEGEDQGARSGIKKRPGVNSAR